MRTPWWRTFLDSFATAARPKRLPKKQQRLQIEVLEDRIVPTVDLWTDGTGTGLWSAPLNWTNGVPGPGDIAQFSSTLPGGSNDSTSVPAGITVAGIEIDSSYAGTITDSVALTIGTSGFSQAGGTFTVSGGPTITLSGSWTESATFNDGSGTVDFNGGATQTLDSGGQHFNNISHAGGGLLQLTGSGLNVDGTLTNAASAGNFDANTQAVSVAGATTITGGTYLASSGTQSFADLDINGGTFTGAGGIVNTAKVNLSSGTLTAPGSAGAFNVAGNWSNTGAAFSNNGGTVNFDGASNQSITSDGGVFNGVTINSSAAVDLADTFSAGAVTVSTGAFNLNGQSAAATGNVVVASPGTLNGPGTITGNLSGSGAISPALSTAIGTLTVNGAFTPSGTVAFVVNSPYATAGADYDQIVASGDVNLSAATLSITGTTTAAAAGPPKAVATLIHNESGSATTPGSTPANQTLISNVNGGNFEIFYDGGFNGDDVVLADATTPTVAYVSPTFTSDGTFVDGDLGTAGTQRAIVGIDAFSTIGAALAAVTASGQVIVNTGTYAEAVDVLGARKMTVTTGAAVTVTSLASDAGTTVQIEGATSSLIVGDLATNATTTVSGTITGPGTLTMQGPGQMTLAGTDIGYTGNTTLSGGTLVLANTAALGSAGQAIALNGGTLDLATDSSVKAYNVTVGGNATIDADRATLAANSTQVLGTLQIGGFQLTVAAGGNVTGGTAGLTFGATTFTGAPTFDITNSGPATTLLTLGAVSNSTFAGTFTGSGNFAQSGIWGHGSGSIILGPAYTGTVTLSQANTYTGGTTLNSGTLAVANVTALGSAGQAVALDGGALDLATDTPVNVYNITVGGNATIESDRATSGAGITQTLGTLSVGSFQLTVTAGANVASGTAGLTFGAATFTGSPTFDIANSAGATTLLTLGAVSNGTGTAAFAGSGNFVQTGVWGPGAGGLTLDLGYTGTVTLSQINTYTGATSVGGGTLEVTGSITSAVTLTNAAVLDGAGTGKILGSVAVDPNALGTVQISNLTIAAPGATGINLQSDTNVIGYSALIENDTVTGSANGIVVGTGTGTATITNSTIAHNTAVGIGMIANAMALTLTNSTVADNAGDGIDHLGGTLTLEFATVAFNGGDGLNNLAGTVNAQDSLFAADTGADYFGSISSAGNNLIQAVPGAATLSGLNLITDLTGVPAFLAALANYGGLTQTCALLPGSAALGAAVNIPGVTTDQRGIARPATPDIGAYQSLGFSVTLVTSNSTPFRTLIDNDFVSDGATPVRFTVRVTASTQGSITFNPNVTHNTILTSPSFTTLTNGEVIYYQSSGTGNPIGGLVIGQAYYVITPGGSSTIQLANAPGGMPLPLGTSSGINHIFSLEPVIGGDVQFTTPVPPPGPGPGIPTATPASGLAPINAAGLANTTVMANGTPSPSTGTTYSLTASAGGSNGTVSWNLYNQVATALAYNIAGGTASAFQPQNAQSGVGPDNPTGAIPGMRATTPGILFKAGLLLGSPTFTATVMDQETAQQPIMINTSVSNISVQLQLVYGNAGAAGTINAVNHVVFAAPAPGNAASAATSLGVATYTDLQIYQSVYNSAANKGYQLAASFTNPGAAAPTTSYSAPFSILPNQLVVAASNFAGFLQKTFAITVASSNRGAIRFVSITEGGLGGLQTNQVAIQALDYTTAGVDALSTTYNGPISLNATSNSNSPIVLQNNLSPYSMTGGYLLVSNITPMTALGAFNLYADSIVNDLGGMVTVNSKNNGQSASFIRVILGRQR